MRKINGLYVEACVALEERSGCGGVCGWDKVVGALEGRRRRVRFAEGLDCAYVCVQGVMCLCVKCLGVEVRREAAG